MISDKVYKLCTSVESVSSLLAKDPSLAPGTAWDKLYNQHISEKNRNEATPGVSSDNLTPEDLERAAECGKWGANKPSVLFLQMFHDALRTLDENVSSAMVSPPLMGSHGVIPLTIISTVPDIARHMSNMIVRAEKEVFLATNYWTNSVATAYITNAMKELSRRAGERGTKIVMKLMYDRGSLKQLFEPHYLVQEKEYLNQSVNLPKSEEIPHIDLQVVNYHKPLLGTFHCKYMIVDRRCAILQSNNLQDNDNLEMMIHLEGPIVDSIYDMALISWHRKLDPPLPGYKFSAVDGRARSCRPYDTDDLTFSPSQHELGQSSESKNSLEIEDSQELLGRSNNIDGEAGGAASKASNEYYPGRRRTKIPDSKINEFLHADRQGQTILQIQKPLSVKSLLPEHTPEDPHYDKNVTYEAARIQTALSPKKGETRVEAVSRHLNHTKNQGFKGTALDCALEEDMFPYILHPTKEPFPIAMVCREPYGPPYHSSVYNPQNEVWLSALRNATNNVFIQSPTLNAEPLIPAIIDACERGVDVYCYITLGYNDSGELLPMQGGTNEMVAHQMFSKLSPTGKDRLHYFWYVAKDQTKPIVAKKKKRSCHVKLMIVDEHIGIQGNGNQDTQSWFHSQEINVMLDSEMICRAWIDGLRRIQSTHLYGEVSQEDGIWRDMNGNQADDVIGVNPGKFGWAKGTIGAINRVRGTGDF